MKLRFLTVIALASSAVLAGCDKAPKMELLLNSDFLLYGNVDDSHLFYKPTLEEFDNLYNSNLGFIIMFSQEGCSACDQFEPKITQYVKETHQLVIKIKDELTEPIRTKYFSDFHAVTPQVFVKSSSDFNPILSEIDYSSYMKTYGVFKRFMNKMYESAKYSYFCGEIAGKTPIFSNFTKVDFVSNDDFKNIVYSKAVSSKNNVVFSTNFEAQSLSIVNSDFSIKKSNSINENLTQIIEQYL